MSTAFAHRSNLASRCATSHLTHVVDGRPDRDEDEIRDWARDHDLPFFDGQVHFPDYRIEYEIDGRERHEGGRADSGVDTAVRTSHGRT